MREGEYRFSNYMHQDIVIKAGNICEMLQALEKIPHFLNIELCNWN